MSENKNDAVALLNAATSTKAAMEKKESTAPAWLESIETLDWQKMPVPVLTQVLTRKPFPPTERNSPQRFLSFNQAFFLALWLGENQLPISGHCWWYNFETDTPELSVEGKLRLARKDGIKLGAPTFNRIPENFKEPLFAYDCALPVDGTTQVYTYRAFLSMFGYKFNGQPKGGLWSNEGGKEHMLRVRAYDGCMKQMGFGFSEPIEEEPVAIEVVNKASNKKLEFIPQGGDK